MLARTDQPYAPVEPDRRRTRSATRRVEVIGRVIERIEQGMTQWGMEPPAPLDGGRGG